MKAFSEHCKTFTDTHTHRSIYPPTHLLTHTHTHTHIHIPPTHTHPHTPHTHTSTYPHKHTHTHTHTHTHSLTHTHTHTHTHSHRSLLAKVKVTSYLIFPDTLDMSHYTGGTSAVYQLTAVIVHCGPSAYSGHYIAHVREPMVCVCVCVCVCTQYMLNYACWPLLFFSLRSLYRPGSLLVWLKQQLYLLVS